QLQLACYNPRKHAMRIEMNRSSRCGCVRLILISILSLICGTSPCGAAGMVFAWGNNSFGQTNVVSGLSNVVAIGAGYSHSLALTRDGTAVGWGAYWGGGYVPVSIPPELTNLVSIGGGVAHGLALRSDGTLAAWGNNSYGQANI